MHAGGRAAPGKEVYGVAPLNPVRESFGKVRIAHLGTFVTCVRCRTSQTPGERLLPAAAVDSCCRDATHKRLQPASTDLSAKTCIFRSVRYRTSRGDLSESPRSRMRCCVRYRTDEPPMAMQQSRRQTRLSMTRQASTPSPLITKAEATRTRRRARSGQPHIRGTIP